MPSKEVCSLVISNRSKNLTIDETMYELNKVSTLELSKYKKKLVDSALKQV